MRAVRMTDTRFQCAIPADFSQVDIQTAFVVLTADTIFLRLLHEGFLVVHVLCYTFEHGECSLLSFH